VSGFPWYDSWWLKRYVRAKHYISAYRPSSLPEFTRAMEPLRTRPDFQLQLLERLPGEDQAETILSAYRSIRKEQLELHELGSHGRFVVHDHPMLDDLHGALAADVSRLVGE